MKSAATEHDPTGLRPVRWQRESSRDCAVRLNISSAAAELFQASEVIDLHVDSYIWTRLFGYRLDKRHGPGLLGARIFSQVDVPRIRQVGVSGATWVVTTNPARTAAGQLRALSANLQRLTALLKQMETDVDVAHGLEDYRKIRALGKHVAFIGIQGGNALALGEPAFNLLSQHHVLRVTLVHLTSSPLGTTSSPLAARQAGLSFAARDCVAQLNERRILVDLAHINELGFFDALAVHDRTLPPIVTHTGVCGAYKHWRNLTDDQIRAIADRGGVIGLMYHTPFLQAGVQRGDLSAVVRHIEHVVRVTGDDYVALGSDWDGAITTPRDMPTCLELPRLVDLLLKRGWSDISVQKLLGVNFLRILGQLRT